MAVNASPAPLTDTWVPTGGPPGGLGYDIRYNFDDHDTWYVTDAEAGIFMSTDNGYTWQPSNTGIPPQWGPTGDGIPVFSLTVDPHNPNIVWAGTTDTGHIYKSTDGGSNWVQSDDGVTIAYTELSFRGFTVDPNESDIVYAMGEHTLSPPAVEGCTTGGVVYKTTDGGLNWSVIWDGGVPSDLTRYMWIDPRDTNVLYVSTGIFDRWGVVGGRECGFDCPSGGFGGLGILKSTDGGQNWDFLDEDNGLGMLYISSLFMHPENPDILLAGAGAIMPPTTCGPPEESPAGVYRTTDGGQNWTHVLVPPPERLFASFSSVEFCLSNPSIAYAASEWTVHRSEDAGETWTLVDGPGWGPPGVEPGFPIDMQCDPGNPDRIFINNYNGGNFLSEDGGSTWQNASQGYTGAQLIHVQVDPFNSARAYAVGRSGIWRTDEAGASWQGVLHRPPDCGGFSVEMRSVALDPTQPGRVLAGSGGSMAESEDGGTSWQCLLPNEDIPQVPNEVVDIVLAPSDPDTIYAGTADICALYHEPCPPDAGWGVIASDDGGTSWRRAVDENLGDVAVLDLAVHPTNAQVVYAAAETGLFKSTDGGASWTPLSGLNGLPAQPRALAVAVSWADPQRVLAGLEGRWTGGVGGVYVSTDGGETWQPGLAGLETNGSLHDIVFDPTDPLVVYTSDNATGVYRSSDGGLSWTQINEGLSNRAVTGLSISSDGQVLYVATNGEGVFRLGSPASPVGGRAEYPDVALSAGWNHACYAGPEAPIETALASVADKTSVVYRMRPDQGYDRWFPNKPDLSTISSLGPYQALLVLASAAATWDQTAAGSEPDSVDLVQGWNSVCYCGQAKGVEEATAAISGDFGILYALGDNQAWHRFVPGRPEVSNLSQLEHCQAVLVLGTREGGTRWTFDP